MFEQIFNTYDFVVASKSVSTFLNQKQSNFLIIEDARSAIYYATGIAAQTQKKVAVIVDGGNESRSAFSGLTEAYYRKLPILLVSLGGGLDYSSNLNDVGNTRNINDNSFDSYDMFNLDLPAHVVVNSNVVEDSRMIIQCKELEQILDKNDYLYVSNNLFFASDNYKCKVVRGGLPNCYDGAIANVLGASLSKLHKRYFVIVTEKEFIHDMNSLGNICFNESIRIICFSKSKTLVDYAKTFGLKIVDKVSELVAKKSILFL